MTRKAINAWYDPDIDTVITEWDATCENKSAYVRDAVREKVEHSQIQEAGSVRLLNVIFDSLNRIETGMIELLVRLMEVK